MCIIVEEESDVAAFKDYVPQPGDDQPPPGAAAAPPAPAPAAAAPPPAAPAAAAPPPPRPTAPVAAPAAAPAGGSGARVFATPLARALAAEKGFDLRVWCQLWVDRLDI